MSFSIPVQTADGKITLLDVVRANSGDQYAIRVQTADGKETLARVAPATSSDQYAIQAQTADGKITLVSLEFELGIYVFFPNRSQAAVGKDKWTEAHEITNGLTEFEDQNEAINKICGLYYFNDQFGGTEYTEIGRSFIYFDSDNYETLELSYTYQPYNITGWSSNYKIVYSTSLPGSGEDMLSWDVLDTVAAPDPYPGGIQHVDISSVVNTGFICVGAISEEDFNNSGYPTAPEGGQDLKFVIKGVQ